MGWKLRNSKKVCSAQNTRIWTYVQRIKFFFWKFVPFKNVFWNIFSLKVSYTFFHNLPSLPQPRISQFYHFSISYIFIAFFAIRHKKFSLSLLFFITFLSLLNFFASFFLRYAALSTLHTHRRTTTIHLYPPWLLLLTSPYTMPSRPIKIKEYRE